MFGIGGFIGGAKLISNRAVNGIRGLFRPQPLRGSISTLSPGDLAKKAELEALMQSRIEGMSDVVQNRSTMPAHRRADFD